MKQSKMGNWSSKISGSNSSKTDFWSTGSYFKNISKKDTEDYRNGYPGKRDHPDWDDNLRFYKNELASTPDGDKIDTIHSDWFEDYKRLERHHGYIQWLFPIRESGMNWSAQELQLHEAEAIQKDVKAYKRVLKSYTLMLNFYGMILKDEETGELERAKNWKTRFEHLNHSYHNYLRISRMLKSLGELGYEHLKKNFLVFILKEALHERTLYNTTESCSNYWIETLRSDKERKAVRRYLYKMQHTKAQPSEEGSDEDFATSKSSDDELTQLNDVMEPEKLSAAAALLEGGSEENFDVKASDDDSTHSKCQSRMDELNDENDQKQKPNDKVLGKEEEMQQGEETDDNSQEIINDLQTESNKCTTENVSTKDDTHLPLLGDNHDAEAELQTNVGHCQNGKNVENELKPTSDEVSGSEEMEQGEELSTFKSDDNSEQMKKDLRGRSDQCTPVNEKNDQVQLPAKVNSEDTEDDSQTKSSILVEEQKQIEQTDSAVVTTEDMMFV